MASPSPLTIVVPIDPVGAARDAERLGAALAGPTGARLELLVAVTGTPTPDLLATMEARCTWWRATDIAEVTWRATDETRPADAIAARSEVPEPLLLCMELTSRHAPRSMLMSTVTEEVLRRSAAPILVAGPHLAPSGPTTHVVAAVDGSEIARAAHQVATTLATLVQADLEVVSVRTERDLLDPERVGSSVRVIDAENRAGAIVAAVGEPSDTLLVIGAHRKPGNRRFALGSVALDVVRAATCPVVLVPPRAVGSALARGDVGRACPTP